MNIEDSARLLAQALVGEGFIYLHGTNEMDGIVAEALFGAEPMKQAKRLFENGKEVEVTSADRVLLISRFSTDEEVVAIAKLQADGHSIVGISAIQEGTESLEQYTDVHIDTKLLKGLIPDDEGNRYGFPSLMIALFAYHGIKFTIDEMLMNIKKRPILGAFYYLLSLFVIEAFTKSWNNGCGRFGRETSSGWNCAATNQG